MKKTFRYYYLPLTDLLIDDKEKSIITIFLTKILQKYQYIKPSNFTNGFDFNYTIDGVYTPMYDSIVIFNSEYRFYKLIKILIDNDYIVRVYDNIKKTKYNTTPQFYRPTNKLLNIKKQYRQAKENSFEYNLLLKCFNAKKENFGKYYFVYENISNLNINITREEFIYEMSINYNHYKENKINTESKYLLKKEYIKAQLLTNYKSIIKWNNSNYTERIEMISYNNLDEDLYYGKKLVKKKSFSRRFYSIFSYIPNSLRKYITFNEMVKFDIAQSQPSFLAKLLLDKNIVGDYIKDINSGDDIYTKMGMYNDRKLNKILFFENIYCNPVYGGKLNDKHINFSINYEKEATYIFKIKTQKNNLKKNYSILSQIITELECKAFHKIWIELKNHNIPFIPIHDEIIISEKNKIKAFDIMYNILQEELNGINFNINEK